MAFKSLIGYHNPTPYNFMDSLKLEKALRLTGKIARFLNGYSQPPEEVDQVLQASCPFYGLSASKTAATLCLTS